MRYILYSFSFLFLAIFAQAQQNIKYISFFPPANIVQNEVFLKQNSESFDQDSSMFNSGMKGSLILGAADNAKINISTMTVIDTSSSDSKLVENFYADNFIKIISTGTNKGIVSDYISIGAPCVKGDCNKIFISSGKMLSAFYSIPYNLNKSIEVNVSDIAYVKNVSIVNGANKRSNLTDIILVNHKLVWCNLRLQGTEVCRKYLVLLPLNYADNEDTDCSLSDKFCREP